MESYIEVPSDFTAQELKRLNAYKTHQQMIKVGLADNSEEEPDVDFFEDPLSPMKLLSEKNAYEHAKIQEYIIKHNLKEEETWETRLCRDLRVNPRPL